MEIKYSSYDLLLPASDLNPSATLHLKPLDEITEEATEDGLGDLLRKQDDTLRLIGRYSDDIRAGHHVPHVSLELVTLYGQELQPDAVPVRQLIFKLKGFASTLRIYSIRHDVGLESFLNQSKSLLPIIAALIIQLPPQDGRCRFLVDLGSASISIMGYGKMLDELVDIIFRLLVQVLTLLHHMTGIRPDI